MLRTFFDTAQGCGLPWQDLRDWVERGSIPKPVVVGGFLRFRQSDLDNWLEAGCPNGSELREAECDPLWDALLHELKIIDERNRE